MSRWRVGPGLHVDGKRDDEFLFDRVICMFRMCLASCVLPHAMAMASVHSRRSVDTADAAVMPLMPLVPIVLLMPLVPLMPSMPL